MTFDLASTRRAFLQGGAAGMALSTMPDKLWSQEAPPPLEQYVPEYFAEAEWTFILAACARLIPSEGDGPGAIEARVPVFIDLQLASDYGRGEHLYMEGPHDPAANPDFGYQTPFTPAEIYRGGIARFDEWCRAEHGAPFAELAPEVQDAALKSLEEDADQVGDPIGPAAGEGEEATGASASSPFGQGGEGAAEGGGEGGEAEGGEGGGEGAATGDEGPGNQAAEEGGESDQNGATTETAAPRIMPFELREFFPLLLQNTKEGYFSDPRYGGNHGMAAWVYIGFPGARANFLEWVDQDNVPYPLGPVSISGERA